MSTTRNIVSQIVRPLAIAGLTFLSKLKIEEQRGTEDSSVKDLTKTMYATAAGFVPAIAMGLLDFGKNIATVKYWQYMSKCHRALWSVGVIAASGALGYACGVFGDERHVVFVGGAVAAATLFFNTAAQSARNSRPAEDRLLRPTA